MYKATQINRLMSPFRDWNSKGSYFFSLRYLAGSFFGLSLLFLSHHISSAQIIRAGFKAGAQVNWIGIDDKSFRDTVKVSPTTGFDIGGAVSFKVRDRYFLHTEYVYSQKRKILNGKIDPLLHDELTYHYVEIPALFTMHFKGRLGENREFKWYMGVGPNVSYWIGGKGVIESSDLKENFVDELRYSIAFGPRQDTQHPEVIYYDRANRFQFGLNVGAGLMFEPGENNKVMLDFRYGFDQTRLGKGLADYQIPADYDDNLRVRNRNFKISIIYLTEFNLDKKSRNKGKSTLKVK
jgi:opacity protein-like surface antigen